jgi:threonine dehydrogenase-like Zn-dependent dehydrogenase
LNFNLFIDDLALHAYGTYTKKPYKIYRILAMVRSDFSILSRLKLLSRQQSASAYPDKNLSIKEERLGYREKTMKTKENVDKPENRGTIILEHVQNVFQNYCLKETEMKGLVLVDKNKVELRDGLPEPVIGPCDVTVAPVIVAPCTSDVHLMESMAIPYLKGKAIGHEMAGHVVEVGAKVKDFKVGDRVTMACGMPDWYNLRVQDGYIKDGDRNVYFDPGPKRHGAFTEKFHILDADMNLAHIPDGVTWEQAVVLTDMGTTAFEGFRYLNIEYGDSVVVLGIGPVGLMAVCASVLKGAGRIFGIGSRQVCFDVAKEYGATDLVSYKDGNITDQVLSKNGKPVDAVIVCGGNSSEIIGDALRMVKTGGTVVNVAGFMGDASTFIPWSTFGTDKSVKNVLCKSGRVFMERLLALVANKRFQPEKIITHTYHGMDKIETALAQMGGNDRTAIKPVVLFE